MKTSVKSTVFEYKEANMSNNYSKFDTRMKKVVEKESEAVELTETEESDSLPNRRLSDFTFHDDDGTMQLIDMLQAKDMYVFGTILPLEEEASEEGVKCSRIGPILEWSISGFDDGLPVLWISTDIAHYECLRPAAGYESFYRQFFGKALACIHTYRALSKAHGGNPNLSLDELLRSVSQSLGESKDQIVSWGGFVYEQLIGLEKSSSGYDDDDPMFSELPVLIALRDASATISCTKTGNKKRKFGSVNRQSTSVLSSRIKAMEKESEAIRLTKIGPSDSPPNRRLTDYTFFDEDGLVQLVDMLRAKNIYVSGLVLPLEEARDNEKDIGVKCERFGPILEWSISGFDDGLPIVWISTENAHYECLQPSDAYKCPNGIFFEKARACVETYRVLSCNTDLSLDELLGPVVNSMCTSENIPKGVSIENLIVSWGRFIYGQLIGLEESNSGSDPTFGELSVLVSLRNSCSNSRVVGKQAALLSGLRYKSCSRRHRLVDNESDAIRFTRTNRNDSPPNRRLTSFSFYDKDGTLQLIDTLELKDIYVSGVILTLDEGSRGAKVKCEGFGPILSWSISGFDEGSPTIWISTDIAHYECLCPASAYKRICNLFLEKARACIMTYQVLSKSPDLSLNELLTVVVHLMSKSGSVRKGKCIENSIVLWGRFIHDQLVGLEKLEAEEDLIFGEVPALIALRNASIGTKTGNEKKTRLNVENRVVKEESEALVLTKTDPIDSPPNRRLMDFSFYDEDGILQPLDMLEVKAVFVTGTILPLEEAKNEMGVKCEGFGPVLEWSISGFDEGSPIIWISTGIAHYECLTPVSAYKRLYSLSFEKARACVETYRTISKSYRGNENLTLSELLASLVRSMSKSEALPTGGSIKDLITSWGCFIYEQLVSLENPNPEKDPIFGDLPLLIAFKNESSRILDSKTRDCDDFEMKLERLVGEKKDWLASFKPSKKLHPSMSHYIKINEDEISEDYPIPAYYKTEVQERDEYMIFDGGSYIVDPNELPRNSLHNWSVYDSEGKMISLELLPMKSCPDSHNTVYGSGSMTADDGIGFYLHDDDCQSHSEELSINATPVFLSSIKEWRIEFRSSMFVISIRTDMSWYRLGKPLKQYARWLKPVLRTARLAIAIITLLKMQSRASCLSFLDIINNVCRFDKSHPGYISSELGAVHRYILVHGQIILQLFSEFSDAAIRKCAFISTLRCKMEDRLLEKNVILQQELNMIPKALKPSNVSQRKVMAATTTKLVNRIWQNYRSNHLYWEHEASELRKIDCDGESIERTSRGDNVDECVVCVGQTAVVRTSEKTCICFIEYMFRSSNNKQSFHGRLLLRGLETVLGDAASERELFLTNECIEFEHEDVIETLALEIHQRSWRYQDRKANADGEKSEKARAEKRKINGLPMEYFCRSLYCLERGAFLSLPSSEMGLGIEACCKSCETKQAQNEMVSKLFASSERFTHQGTRYDIHDYLYLSPLYDAENEKRKTSLKNSGNVGLKSYIVCQLLGVEINSSDSSGVSDPESVMIKVRRFFKPEDISAEKAFISDLQEVYYSEEIVRAPVAAVEGKCDVRYNKDFHFKDRHNRLNVFEHVFFCQHMYDPKLGTLKQLPCDVELSFYSKERIEGENKYECNENSVCDNAKSPLATLDLFAGCGGLSEGLKQSGVSVSKWAIECDEVAAESFKINHSEAVTIATDCNVILRAIMIACGDEDECGSSSDVAELASKLDEKLINILPRPGEVEFIVGGPPCQGFSRLNRYPQTSWSQTQCEMILSFLSYVDYFRPKFALLENVRNFVSFDKGKMFHLTLASLLEMGYQVRFGILEAGAYGVAQTRKRAFIWAASPEATLPEWPEPMHVFSGPELKIRLDSNGKTRYNAVHSTATGAPLRSITVRDTISDLPLVRNGALATTMEYGSEPLSWFQKKVRGDTVQLVDHVSKEMNQLNLIRCRKIPKCPGADWHDLPREKVQLSTGQVANLVPKFLKNTAKKHNGWKGIFGRLDWEGNFPTAVTDPTPVGIVGMCLHPEQDRIITVRECARSQGFPDSYRFAGNIQQKHRQIGNAVPPPLAFALGRKLGEAIDHNLYYGKSRL